MAQRILAIEVTQDSVRAAAAERTWNSFRFLGAIEEHRAGAEEDLGPALERVLERTGHPDVVISALPSELIAKRMLELPFGDSRRLHQVVPFALEEHLPFGVEDGVVSFQRIGRDGNNSVVLAALARKQDLEQHLQLLERAGLDPKTVTLAPLAMAALFARARNGASLGPYLVLESDSSTTSMVLLDPNGTPRALRTVGAGLVSSNGDTPDQTLVVNAVRQTLLAHARDAEQAHVVLAGPAAATPKVKSLLADALAVAVRDANEIDYSPVLGGPAPEAPRYTSCVAMLLGELPQKPLELLNFRQGQFMFRGRVRGDLTPFYTTLKLAGVAAALVVLHFGLSVWSGLHRLHGLNQQIAAVAAPALGDLAGSDPESELRNGVIQMRKRSQQLGGNQGRNSALDALLAVSQAIPPNVPLQMEDVQIDTAGMKLSGHADSFAAVDQAKRALDASGFFGTIQVTHAQSGADASKIEFRMNAAFKDALSGGS
jgi:type II secretory pathway component PulL